MAIGNYAELQTAIANWLARDDLAAVIPDFVRLADSRINQELRTREMVARAKKTVNAGEQYLTLPADFLEARNIQVNGSPERMLRYRTPDTLDQRHLPIPAGKPAFYTFIGDEIQLAPVPDATCEIEIAYYASPAPLADNQPTNWLLRKHPEVYLYGALIEAAAYIGDDKRISLWTAGFTNSINNINKRNKRAIYSGSSLEVVPT